MTPLQLSILLHYRGHATDFRDGDFSAPAVRESIDWFRDEARMLEATNGDPHSNAAYRLTDKGEAFVEALCAMPLPVCKWEIPSNAVGQQEAACGRSAAPECSAAQTTESEK